MTFMDLGAGNNIEAAGAEAIAKSLATNQQPHFALDLSCTHTNIL